MGTQRESRVDSPIVIGGVGGSGTRVVAHTLRELGFHIGDDLNYALDNLWFTMLFRRSELGSAPAPSLQGGIRLFTDAMLGRWAPDDEQSAFLSAAINSTESHLRLNQPGRDPSAWTGARLESLRRAGGPEPDQVGWGWKEPCSHVFLEPLAGAFDDLRYIHIIRNGLELARKPLTHFQIGLWGPLYGIDPPADPTGFEADIGLRFWVRSNQRALSAGEELLGERFLPLHYESLCEEPRSAIEAIARFVGAEPSAGLLDELAAFVKPPPGTPRAEADAGAFAAEDLAAVREMGFAV